MCVCVCVCVERARRSKRTSFSSTPRASQVRRASAKSCAELQCPETCFAHTNRPTPMSAHPTPVPPHGVGQQAQMQRQPRQTRASSARQHANARHQHNRPRHACLSPPPRPNSACVFRRCCTPLPSATTPSPGRGRAYRCPESHICVSQLRVLPAGKKGPAHGWYGHAENGPSRVLTRAWTQHSQTERSTVSMRSHPHPAHVRTPAQTDESTPPDMATAIVGVAGARAQAGSSSGGSGTACSPAPRENTERGARGAADTRAAGGHGIPRRRGPAAPGLVSSRRHSPAGLAMPPHNRATAGNLLPAWDQPRPHLKMLSRMWARAALGECRVAGRSRTGQALSRVFCGAGRPVLPAVAASAARPGASCRGEGLRCGSMRLAPRCACLMGDHAAQGTWRGLGRNGDGMAGTHSAAAGCWCFPPWAPRSPRSPAAATRAVSARFRRAGMVYARTCREEGGLTCRTSERVCVLRTLGSRSQGRPRRWDTQGRRG